MLRMESEDHAGSAAPLSPSPSSPVRGTEVLACSCQAVAKYLEVEGHSWDWSNLTT